MMMPADEISKLDVSMTNPDKPPPMVVVPVDDPMLIVVSKLDDSLRDTVLPWEVKPAKTACPADVMFPVLVTSKLLKSIPAVVPVSELLPKLMFPEKVVAVREFVPPVIDNPLAPVIKLELSIPANTPAPAPVTDPALDTSKLVKSMSDVPAVLPDKMVSHPVPTLMALEVEPPVADEMLIPVPLVMAVPDRDKSVPEVAVLAVTFNKPVPV